MMQHSKIKIIRGSDIEEATSKEYRQYLVGDLKNPQLLDFVKDNVEIGISSYKEFTSDVPHKHPVCSEYNYILEGTTKVLIIEDNVEFTFEKGDFFSIPVNTPYASKHKGGTKVLFFKNPSINDKTKVEVTKELSDWLNKW